MRSVVGWFLVKEMIGIFGCDIRVSFILGSVLNIILIIFGGIFGGK